MKVHITGTEEAIKQINRLKEILDEAGKIIWALHIGTSLDYEGGIKRKVRIISGCMPNARSPTPK